MRKRKVFTYKKNQQLRKGKINEANKKYQKNIIVVTYDDNDGFHVRLAHWM